jgi:hypothetical protein
MDYMDYKKVYETLRKAGWKIAEMERLIWFRQNYRPSRMDEPALDERHLEFIRWLILHGKLT